MYFYSLKYFKILKNFKLKIIAVNNFHKLQLIELGISQNKITVINNPLNLSIKKIKTKENSIVYAGRLSKEKGLIELLEAWKEADIKDYNLLIIGDGELRNQLKNRYTASNVKFLGFCQMKKYLNISRNV